MLKNKIAVLLITWCVFIFPLQDGKTAEEDGLSSLEVVETPRQTKSDAKQKGLYEPQNKAQALMKTGETPFHKQLGGDDGEGQGGSQIKQLQVTSENTVDGSITAKGRSEVSVGSTHLGDKGDGATGGGSNGNSNINPNINPPIPITDPCAPKKDARPEERICSDECVKSKIKNKEEICHIVDGCSGPAAVPQNDSWSSLFTVFGKPEDCCKPPEKIYPCNQHDRCYQTCNKNNSQEKCDKALLNDMFYACDHNLFSNIKDSILNGISIAAHMPPDTLLFNCKAQAKIFYSVLSEKGLGKGSEAWKQRQTQFGCNKHE